MSSDRGSGGRRRSASADSLDRDRGETEEEFHKRLWARLSVQKERENHHSNRHNHLTADKDSLVKNTASIEARSSAKASEDGSKVCGLEEELRLAKERGRKAVNKDFHRPPNEPNITKVERKEKKQRCEKVRKEKGQDDAVLLAKTSAVAELAKDKAKEAWRAASRTKSPSRFKAKSSGKSHSKTRPRRRRSGSASGSDKASEKTSSKSSSSHSSSSPRPRRNKSRASSPKPRRNNSRSKTPPRRRRR